MRGLILAVLMASAVPAAAWAEPADVTASVAATTARTEANVKLDASRKPAEILAFLGLECTMLTARWVGPRLAARCAQALGDAPPEAVLDLYVACRAVLRARLSLAHLLEPDPRTPWKWLPVGRRYLGQARVALDAVAERPRSG